MSTTEKLWTYISSETSNTACFFHFQYSAGIFYELMLSLSICVSLYLTPFVLPPSQPLSNLHINFPRLQAWFHRRFLVFHNNKKSSNRKSSNFHQFVDKCGSVLKPAYIARVKELHETQIYTAMGNLIKLIYIQQHILIHLQSTYIFVIVILVAVSNVVT